MIFPIKINELTFTCGSHNELANDRLRKPRNAAHPVTYRSQAARFGFNSVFEIFSTWSLFGKRITKKLQTLAVRRLGRSRNRAEKRELLNCSIYGRFSAYPS